MICRQYRTFVTPLRPCGCGEAMRRHFIVSYDIADPVRLRKVHKTLCDFGDGIQLSVFCCQLSKKDRALLEARLAKVIHHHQDQVIFVDLGECKRDQEGPPACEVLGRPLAPGYVRCVVV